ncbi:MAG TPA: hypothetical protein VJ875_25680 [Pyrinomonadaceae bacterium]|nr:hypothetical protein [Pyrinomonadaceae bacterium]
MKRCRNHRWFSLLLVLLTSFSAVMAQRITTPARVANVSPELSVEKQDALDLLRTLGQNLRSESDKLAAGRLQARIADELWRFDESVARQIFRWAFEAVSQPMPEGISDSKQAAYLLRQANAVTEVLRLFGTHDKKGAEAWLKAFEDEPVVQNLSPKPSSLRLELLMQLALQIAPTDAEQATRLGVISLSGTSLPNGFPSLLFTVGNQDRKLSDDLFRAAITSLRRNQYVNDPALIAMSNYLFTSGDQLQSAANLSEAQLLANYFVDAAWHQAGGEGSSLSASTAGFYALLETRAVPIVARYAPDRLPELRGQMNRLATGLTPEQMQRTNLLRSAQQQQTTISERNNYSIEEQIERAEKEKDLQVRDALLNSIAHMLMRRDPEKALTVSSQIDDVDLRKTTEDDINLVKIQQCLNSRSYDEARKTSSKLNNSLLKAKIVVQIAAKVLSDNKDTALCAELLSEAVTLASKSEDSADKVITLLHAVEQFARFDSIRAFETLTAAISILNRVKVEKETPRSSLANSPLLRVKSYTVINGREMTTSNDATLESIDFSQIRSLVVQDYMQSRLTANKIEQPLQRANFLTAVAATILRSENRQLSTSRN